MSRVVPPKRRRNPLLYPPRVGFNLFCRCSLASLPFFHQSTFKIPTLELNLKSGVNNPFRHSSLKPLHLFQLFSARSSVNPSRQLSLKSGFNDPFYHSSLKPLQFPNQSNVQSSTSLNLFCRPSLKPRASSRRNNGDIYRGFIQPWGR